MEPVQSFVFNNFAENTYLISDSGQCIIVDPGCYIREETELLKNYIESKKLTPVSIINTHCHIDHVLGVNELKEFYKIPFLIGRQELHVLQGIELYAPVYGFPAFQIPETDGFLDEGEEVKVGNTTLKVLNVPGHSPGHIAFYNRTGNFLISGDVLFKSSIGRTDLPGGDYETLIHSIKSKIFTLRSDTIVYPGHGPATTVEDEKKFNPFFGEIQ